MGWITDLFSSGAAKLTETATKGLDELFTSKEELGEQTIKLEEVKRIAALDKMNFEIELKRFQADAENREFEDRKNAREMQMKTKSRIPGFLAIVFTASFFGTAAAMMYIVINKASMPEFAIMFISTIFGNITSILGMIMAFYFGSSKAAEDQGEKLAANAMKANEK